MKRLYIRILVTLALASILSACGGGSSGNKQPNPPPPPPPPPPAAESPGGIWRGTLTSNVLNQVEEIVGVITENGKARFVSLDGGQQFFGQITVNGNSASGTLRAVSFLGGQFADGTGSGSINIEVTIDERNTISGTFIGVGDEGTFSVSFDSLYDLDSSIALVEKHWTAPETIFKVLIPGFGNAPIGASVDSTGGFAGADLDGCDYNGSLSILNAQFNIYDISVSLSSCGQWDGQYSGFGVFDDLSAATNSLLIAVSTDQVSLTGLLTETIQEAASGLWSGIIQSNISGAHEAVGMISEEGDAQFFSRTGAQIAGSAESFGNIFRLSAVAYAPFGTTHPDGSVRGAIDARGPLITAFQSTGAFNGVGDSGVYDIFYSSVYERPSSIVLVEGSWSIPSPTGGVDDLIITVLASGEFSGTADGCNYDGTISLINASFNMYRLEIDVLNCSDIDGRYSGLGALSDDQSMSDTLVVSVNNDTSSLWAFFGRVP